SQMEEAKEGLSIKGTAERLTLGIIRILENMPGVVDVRFAEREPAEKRRLLSWEQKNTCILPEDLRDFYQTTDGFTLTWSIKLDNEFIPLGCMKINSVAMLCPLLQPVSLYSLPNAPSLVPTFIIIIITSSIQINVFITNSQNIKIWQMLQTGLKF
uniref:Tubulin polyglutamylase complex subunit 2 n=1 Tax=Takifugu rubripes TaxID=31033 RepID=A0A674MMY9_TAKRU